MSPAIVHRKTSSSAPEAIVSAALARIRSDSGFAALQRQPLPQLRAWLESALHGMAMWHDGTEFSAVMHVYIDLGREGQHNGIPAMEMIAALAVLVDAAGAVNCGEEWESGIHVQSGLKALDTFCDFAKYYLARGYQDSSR